MQLAVPIYFPLTATREALLLGDSPPSRGVYWNPNRFSDFILQLGQPVWRLRFQTPRPFLRLTMAMLKRILLILALGGALTCAAQNPSPVSPTTSSRPSEASIKQLLEVAQSHKLVDAVMGQMDNLMQQTIAQATRGQQVPPKIQKDIDQRHGEMMALMKELLDWKKLEPIYVRIYQKTFTQQEIDGMIAFYKTSAGQAVISKMPAAMQNTMDEMQGLMAPVMEKMQRMQQEVAAGIKAESKNKGG